MLAYRLLIIGYAGGEGALECLAWMQTSGDDIDFGYNQTS